MIAKKMQFVNAIKKIDCGNVSKIVSYVNPLPNRLFLKLLPFLLLAVLVF